MDGKPISVFRKRRLISQGITQSPHLSLPRNSSSTAKKATPSDPSNTSNSTSVSETQSSPLVGVQEKRPAGFRGQKPEDLDPTRDPHGGAPPEAILRALHDSMDDPRPRRNRGRGGAQDDGSLSLAQEGQGDSIGRLEERAGPAVENALLKDISNENNRLVSNMSQAEIQEFLESVRGVVGSDTLERFARRPVHPASHVSKSQTPQTETPTLTTPAAEETVQLSASQEKLHHRGYAKKSSSTSNATASPSSPESPPKNPSAPDASVSKSVRFSEHTYGDASENMAQAPDEDDAGNLLETHHAGQSSARPDEPQFTRTGAVVSPSFARGWDDTTDDNDVYALDDLLLLCRSSSVPQRRLFLSLTAHVLRLHGQPPPAPHSAATTMTSSKDREQSPPPSQVWELLVSKEAAVRAALVAGWQVGDNAVSVRLAALDLLSAAVDVLPAHLEARARLATLPNGGRITTSNEAAAALHHLGVIHKLGANVRSTSGFDSEQLFNVLAFLAQWSAAAAHAINASPSPSAALASAADLGGEQSQIAPLVLLDAMVCFSAQAAQKLLEQKPLGLQDVLLRVLATMEVRSIEMDVAEQTRAVAAVRILHHLSLYGLAADLAQLLWNDLSRLLVQLTAHPAATPELLSHTLQLLTAWTVASSDPHLTAGGHDVEFHMVREWPSFSLDVIRAAVQGQAQLSDCVLVAACDHVRVALAGVQRNTNLRLPTVATPGPDDQQGLLRHFSALALRVRVAFQELDRTHAFDKTAQTLQAATSVLALCAQMDALPSSVLNQAQELALCLLSAREALSVSASLPTWRWTSAGKLSPRAALVRYLANLSLIATKGHARAVQRQLIQRALILLLPHRGEEHMAQTLSCILLEGAPILSPFYRTAFQAAPQPPELAHKETDAPALCGPNAHTTVFGILEPKDLRAYQARGSINFAAAARDTTHTLPPELKPEQSSASTNQKERNEDGEGGRPELNDLDPATGNPFWRSPANGLPVRTDWPLSPLDDLLHSASSAVFNSPGSLPPEWDFTEKQIVWASLALAENLFASSIAAFPERASGVIPQEPSAAKKRQEVDFLPSPAELWFGLIKVFLLESQASVPVGDKATGLVTGRDLFADPGIASRMRKLAYQAVQLERDDYRSEPLETVAQRQGYPSFYQLFTDLLGVWDAQSMGDPLFALTVLQPTKMMYPAEHRLLFWHDYRHLLRTVPTVPDEVDLRAFVEPKETDFNVLAFMGAALVNGLVTEANPLLWKISITHIGNFLFGHTNSIEEAAPSSSPSSARHGLTQMAKMLFGPAGSEHVVKFQLALFAYTDSVAGAPAAGEAAQAERRKLVASLI